MPNLSTPTNLDEIRNAIKDKTCKLCTRNAQNTPLKDGEIEYYRHPGGFELEGLQKKQWIYVVCPNKKCKYQWALHKLGIYQN